MTQHSSSGPNLTIRTSIIKIYYQTIFHLEKGSVKAVIFSISHYILGEKMDKQPSLEALLLSPGVWALVCGPRGGGGAAGDHRQRDQEEVKTPGDPQAGPQRPAQIQWCLLRDPLWQSCYFKILGGRFRKLQLHCNFGAPTPRLLHKHVPQGCDVMVFWENKGEPPNIGSLRKGKHFKAPGLGSTSRRSPEKGTLSNAFAGGGRMWGYTWRGASCWRRGKQSWC